MLGKAILHSNFNLYKNLKDIATVKISQNIKIK